MSLLRRPEVTLFILFLTLNFTACTSTLPDQLEKELKTVLIEPSKTVDHRKLLSTLSSTQLDSLLYILQQRYHKEPEVTFRDTKGPWILGIDTTINTSANQKMPLIVYLHGGIGSNRTDKGSNAYEMLQFLNRDSKKPFLLASPSGNRDAPWWSEEGIERVFTTVRYMCVHYNIDRERIYLAGVSDGGTGVFAIANQPEHPFAAFAAISGFGGMLPRLGISLRTTKLAQHPIYMINAGKDHLYPMPYVQQFAQWLQQQGVPLQTAYYPNEKHGFSYRERELKKLVHFFSQKRSSDEESPQLYKPLLKKR